MLSLHVAFPIELTAQLVCVIHVRLLHRAPTLALVCLYNVARFSHDAHSFHEHKSSFSSSVDDVLGEALPIRREVVATDVLALVVDRKSTRVNYSHQCAPRMPYFA